MMSILRVSGIFRFLLGNHSARNATIITTALNIAGKCFGYVRTLLVAYFFGASYFVDAYYVAFGAITFLTGTIQGTVESAVLPKMIQNDESTAKDLLGWVVSALALIMGCASILLLLFPEQYVRIFASTFDEMRLFHAGNMVKWILPYALANLGIGILSIWGNYRQRFTVASTIMVFSNVLSIPTLFALHPLIGNYALPAFQSLSFSVLALCLWYFFRDMPLRPRHKVQAKLLRRTGRDILYCIANTGAVFIYTLIDRYFASSLPVGNVAAISYAQLLFSQPMGFMGSAMSIYLVRASEAVRTQKEGESQLYTTLFMGWSYFLPAALLLAALARPVVSLLLGYGAFDAKAVAITSPCLAVMALGIPVLIWNMVMGKYAQALGRLKLLAVWSYMGVVGNFFLDWAFVKPFGAPGLCAATVIMWAVSTFFFMVMLAPSTIMKLVRSLVLQTIIAIAWAVPLWFLSRFGTLLPLTAGVVVGTLHIVLCDKFGLFCQIPENWRPLPVAQGFVNKIIRPEE